MYRVIVLHTTILRYVTKRKVESWNQPPPQILVLVQSFAVPGPVSGKMFRLFVQAVACSCSRISCSRGCV